MISYQSFPRTLLVFALLFALISCGGESVSPDMTDMQNGGNSNGGGTNDMSGEATKAPDFNLTSVNGGEVSLSNFSGKPLVIFFFGSTCSLCIASAPSVESKIHSAFASDKMKIIGIDTWDGNKAAVTNFKTNTGVTFDLLLEGSKIQSSYNTTYDRLVVIDKNGNIAYKGTSSASSSVDDVATLLKDLIE
ncbi:MAG: TlpA family protein disulfide reductase [Cyclobacteriaceae bacterium]